MSIKALHATFTIFGGMAVGCIWLAKFWAGRYKDDLSLIIFPLFVAVLGLLHWINYDYSLGHWASAGSVLQAVFNVGVVILLLSRRYYAPAIDRATLGGGF